MEIIVQPEELWEILPRFPHTPPCPDGKCRGETDVIQIRGESGSHHDALSIDLHYPGQCSTRQPKAILHVQRPDGSVQMRGVSLTQLAYLHDVIGGYLARLDRLYGGIQSVKRRHAEPGEVSRDAS